MDTRDSLEIIGKHLESISRSLHIISFQLPTFLSAISNSMLSQDDVGPINLICLCRKNKDGSLKEYNSACPMHTTTTKHYLDEKIHSQDD